MSVTIKGFNSKRAKELADAIRAGANRVQREVAVAVLQPVITGTPVGNVDLWSEVSRRRAPANYVGGRARGNWFVQMGAASAQTTATPDPSGGATISRGTTQIAGATGQPIHITNNLPYIIPLNDGHSHQAPAGFVEAAVAAGIEARKRMRVLP